MIELVPEVRLSSTRERSVPIRPEIFGGRGRRRFGIYVMAEVQETLKPVESLGGKLRESIEKMAWGDSNRLRQATAQIALHDIDPEAGFKFISQNQTKILELANHPEDELSGSGLLLLGKLGGFNEQVAANLGVTGQMLKGRVQFESNLPWFDVVDMYNNLKPVYDATLTPMKELVPELVTTFNLITHNRSSSSLRPSYELEEKNLDDLYAIPGMVSAGKIERRFLSKQHALSFIAATVSQITPDEYFKLDVHQKDIEVWREALVDKATAVDFDSEPEKVLMLREWQAKLGSFPYSIHPAQQKAA